MFLLIEHIYYIVIALNLYAHKDGTKVLVMLYFVYLWRPGVQEL
jgi:hypothetical protein